MSGDIVERLQPSDSHFHYGEVAKADCLLCAAAAEIKRLRDEAATLRLGLIRRSNEVLSWTRRATLAEADADRLAVALVVALGRSDSPVLAAHDEAVKARD